MNYKFELIAVAESWLNPQYSLRQQAIEMAAAEFGLSPQGFALALDWIFSQWHLNHIESLASTNPYSSVTNAAQIVAGNTPAVIAQAFLQAVILDVPQFIKIPSQCQTFCKLLYKSLVEKIPMLSRLLQLDSDLQNLRSTVKNVDLLIVYGSDETIADIQNYIGPQTKIVGHGHAISAAIIFKEAATKNSLQQLAWDMLSYDQRGCLSPRVCFIEADGVLSPATCAKVFAEEILPALAEKLPRGELFADESINILQARMLYRFRGKVFEGRDWTVTYDENLMWPAESLPRFMPFKSFATISELKDIFASVENHLICIGYEGPTEKITELGKNQKICKLGTMQQQLLDWEIGWTK